MSRIGRTPIVVPAGVEIKMDEHNNVTVKGPKGTLSQTFNPKMIITVDAGLALVERPDDAKENRSVHGLTRTLLNNMVVGVTDGFKKELEVHGIGYRAAKDGKKLVLNVGYSHQVFFEDNSDISIEVPAPNRIIIGGIDKQKVGQFAANVRKTRPPEPYKGKGIRYLGEYVRRKEGKAGGKKK